MCFVVAAIWDFKHGRLTTTSGVAHDLVESRNRDFYVACFCEKQTRQENAGNWCWFEHFVPLEMEVEHEQEHEQEQEKLVLEKQKTLVQE